LARDGFALKQLKAAEARLEVKLPKALWDYYTLVGQHPINRAHNRLLSPDALFLGSGHLVFMEENQTVVYWGLRCRELGKADPTVLQTAGAEDKPWYSERVRCSEFLTAMLYWQAVGGGLPHIGYTDPIGLGIVRQVEGSWPLIARIQGLSAYGKAGQAICILFEEKTAALVQVGARTKRDYRDIEKRLGIGINEA
jgi:hypothetical protein